MHHLVLEIYQMNVTTSTFRKLIFSHQESNIGASWNQLPSRKDQLATIHRQDNGNFLSSTPGIVMKIDHMLAHKCQQFKKIEIILFFMTTMV